MMIMDMVLVQIQGMILDKNQIFPMSFLANELKIYNLLWFCLIGIWLFYWIAGLVYDP